MSILPTFQPSHQASFGCAQSGCRDCQNALMTQHEGLVHWIVRRQYRGSVEYAELVQEGRIGLWRAILRYEPEPGYTFSTYASVVIRHRIWKAVRRSEPAKGWMNVSQGGDLLAELEYRAQQEQLHQALSLELAGLPERLRQVVNLAYGLWGDKPLSLAAIGRQMGLSRERIRQLRNAALALLRLPALSIRLRRLYERDTRRDYRQARQLSDQWLSSRRRSK